MVKNSVIGLEWGMFTIAIAVISGYVLGSIPSSYILGRLRGIDLRKEGDGHIGATAIYRELGKKGLALAVVMDIAKTLLALYIAWLLGGSVLAMVLTACAAIVGHCWSVFLAFKGGLGAVVTFTALAALGPVEFAVAGITAGIISLLTRKSSLGTYVMMGVAAVAFIVEGKEMALVLFPVAAILIQSLKKLQIRSYGPTAFQNNLFSDLKRVKKPGDYPATPEGDSSSGEPQKEASKKEISLPTYSRGRTK